MAAASADSVRVTMPNGQQGEVASKAGKYYNVVVMDNGEHVIVDTPNLCAMLKKQGKTRAT